MLTSNLVISLDDRKIVIMALSVQIAFLGTLGLHWVGLEIPILRQILGFSYLTFIPGILILGLLNTEFSKLNTYLYGTGISIVFIMLIGLFNSLVLPFFGIPNPLSLEFLIITVATITIFLCFIIYKRRGRTRSSFLKIER